MTVGENFTFFLPVMMASFGIVFLLFLRWCGSEAAYWSAGFFCLAAGCLLGFVFAALSYRVWNVLADLFFASGFLFFGEAMLKRWRPGWLLSARLFLCISAVMICTAASAMNNAHLELFVLDMSCFLLIALPLIVARPSSRSQPDQVLFAAGLLFAINNFALASTIYWTLPDGENYFTSQYAYVEQAFSSVFVLFLALSALAAIVLDQLISYRHAAHVDPLSGLLNRRGFDEAVKQKVAVGGSLLVCDIDHFKAVNDRYGHMLGDRVIAILAEMLRDLSPKNAVGARFGGEEFVLFLPGVDAGEATVIANRAREIFAEMTSRRLNISYNFSVSFGIAALQDTDLSIHDGIARADAALYEAKALGRNRVCEHWAIAHHLPNHSSGGMPFLPDAKKAARNRTAISCSN